MSAAIRGQTKLALPYPPFMRNPMCLLENRISVLHRNERQRCSGGHVTIKNLPFHQKGVMFQEKITGSSNNLGAWACTWASLWKSELFTGGQVGCECGEYSVCSCGVDGGTFPPGTELGCCPAPDTAGLARASVTTLSLPVMFRMSYVNFVRLETCHFCLANHSYESRCRT
jgi:hypothetical protein